MPRHLSVRLGEVHTLPVAHHPLYAAIDAELQTGSSRSLRATPWTRPMLGVAFGAALLLPGMAGAATITVNSTAWTSADDGICTLPEAVNSANTNTASGASADECGAGEAGLDEIQFDASLLNSTINVDAELAVAAAEPLDIVGPGTADQLVLDGGDAHRLLQASADVSVSNLTVRNFYSSGAGGAILSNAAVTVSNSHFDNNYAYDSGGAINAASVTVSNSQFTSNDSKYGSGGAIQAPVTNVTSSTFSGNTAFRFGGAINAYAAATVSGSTFTNNETVYDSGGAIATNLASISGNSVFSNNSAGRTGGAVFAFYGGSITASSFSYNESASGGAVFAGSLSSLGIPELHGFGKGQRKLGPGLPQLDLSIVDSQFDHNRADNPYGTSMGGAVAASPFFAYDSYTGTVSSNTVTISGSLLTDNVAFPSYVPSQPPPLAGGQEQGKLAPGPLFYGTGGGLMVGRTDPVAGVTVAGRKAGKVAPPPFEVSVDIDSTTFANNLAFIGGGAMVMGSTVTVDDSNFNNNGGLYLGGGGAFLPAALKYGGPASAATDSVAFANTTFDANRSLFGAAGVMAFTGEISGNALDLTNNQTALHSGFYGVIPTATLSAAGIGKAGKQVGPTYCSAGKYGGGGLLMSISSTQLTGASQITGNCAGIGIGGVGVGSGKYSGVAGSLLVAPDTVVSGNSSYASNPGMNAVVGYSGSGSIGGTFTGNVVQGDQPGSGGGLLLNTGYSGSLSVSQATVSGNFAASGGGIAIHSVLNPSSTLGSVSISDSTISGNTAVQGAGVSIAPTYSGSGGTLASTSKRFPRLSERLSKLGIRQPLLGGKRDAADTAKGVVTPLSVSMQNTTIDGNTTSSTTTPITEQGGGLFAQYTSLALDHVTITGNSTAGDGGGVMLSGVTPTVSNSIIGLNTATGTGPDANGTLDIDYSLVQDSTGATLNGANNLTGVDPLLDPLAANGGPTQTRLPQLGSPVVDAGDPAFVVASLPDDQRGSGFPRDAGGRTDMGAVEGITPREVISIAIAPNPFAEGTASTMTVTLDGMAQVDTVVTVDFSGSAVLDTDFTSGDADGGIAGTQVLVPGGSSSGSVQLDATTDSLHEGDEPFTATASAADFATIPVTPPSFLATITDADALAFSIDDVSGSEAAGNFVFTVSLNVPSTQPVSVDATTADGTALAGADYTAVATSVNFPAGSTSQTVSVPITNDAVAEAVETFAVNLSNPSAGGIADASGTGTITDDEAAPTATLSLTPPSNPEGGGNFMVTVNLSGPSSGQVVVTLGFGGSATFGSDYTVEDQDPGTPGIQIVIPPGATSGSVMITPLTDGEDEPDEDIVVSIASATGATGSAVAGSGTIVGGSAGPVAIQGPELIPTLNEWMLMLLGLLLPAAVMVRLRGGRRDDKLEA